MQDITGVIPFQIALDAANIGVWHWEPRSGAVDCSARARTLCGVGEDAPGTLDMFLSGMHPDDKHEIVGAMMHAAVEGTRVRNECRVVNANTHTERWVLIEGCKYLDESPVVHLAGTVRDVSRLKQADTEHEITLNEMEHRLRNIFTIISAVVSLSERTAETSGQLAETLRVRIGALHRAHHLLPAADFPVAVELRQVVETELAAFSDLSPIRISGPPVRLGRNQVVAVHMIAHELTTNALKYGALADPRGRLEIQWSIQKNSLVLCWKETRCGPLVPPTHSGFGSRLLLMCARLNLGGDIAYDYEPDGIRVTLIVPLSRLGM
jgi:two-component sensor histidine kinase